MLSVILLATYNGEQFLREQLDSIFAQSYPHLLVIALDDGSTDNTVTILRDYQTRYGEKLRFLGVTASNLGPIKAYSTLLEYTLANEQSLYQPDDEVDGYCIAFADQDDTWQVDKLSLAIGQLKKHSDGVKPQAILVHSELEVVDSQGRLLSPRLSDYQGLRPQRDRLLDLLMQNCVTGCTAVITPALARLATPIPAEVMMHDWWLALVASLYGRIVFIDQALVAYRQHGKNTLGAKPRQAWSALKKLRSMTAPPLDGELRNRAQQAAQLLRHHTRQLDWRQKLLCRLLHLQRFNSLPVRALTQLGAKYLRHYDHAWAKAS